MISLFEGKSGCPHRRGRGTVANGYMAGGFAFDSPEGVEYPGNPLIIITHAHCDHICGLDSQDLQYACSEFVAGAIKERREDAALCRRMNLSIPKKLPSRILRDGETLEAGGVSIKALSTPGHSAGSMCFYMPQGKALFSGDTVFGKNCLPALSLPTSNPRELLESYEKLSSLEIGMVYPGHGAPFDGRDYVRRLIPMLKEFI